jgi:hypothetical protein
MLELFASNQAFRARADGRLSERTWNGWKISKKSFIAAIIAAITIHMKLNSERYIGFIDIAFSGYVSDI